jgi:hypothetical protein
VGPAGQREKERSASWARRLRCWAGLMGQPADHDVEPRTEYRWASLR